MAAAPRRPLATGCCLSPRPRRAVLTLRARPRPPLLMERRRLPPRRARCRPTASRTMAWRPSRTSPSVGCGAHNGSRRTGRLQNAERGGWKMPSQKMPAPALEGGSPAAAATVVARMPAVRANSFEWLPADPPAPAPAPAPECRSRRKKTRLERPRSVGGKGGGSEVAAAMVTHTHTNEGQYIYN